LNAPAVALAAFPRVEDVAGLMAAGAAAVLAKPFDCDDLMLLVDRLTGVGRESERRVAAVAG
jgi:CheY-like chemotaxis protein